MSSLNTNIENEIISCSENGSKLMTHLAAAEGLYENSIQEEEEAPPKSSDSDLSVATKSIAASSALVGETIMESPTSTPRKVKIIHQNDAMRELMQAPHHQTRREWISTKVHNGWNWLQRKRQERQQHLLEQQVEEQRRILYEAQFGTSLATNTAFSSITKQQQQHSSIKPSLSGSGVQVVDILNKSESENGSEKQQYKEEEVDVMPQVRLVEESSESPPFILSKPIMQLLLEKALPPSITYSKWKRLYSLLRDGDDFGEFLRRVDKQTHTLLVVKTTTDAVFGSYTESPWTPHAEGFYGLGHPCLFKVLQDKSIDVFKWTGLNRYIQVCDLAAKTLCMGGGGDSFGLCLQENFSVGSTGPCETFGNAPLCKEENFQILDIEVYGFLLGQF